MGNSNRKHHSARPTAAGYRRTHRRVRRAVATAVAAATTRADLIASRARIVVAADDARRRLERDIHDGAQQRLISLGLKLRLAEESVPTERDDLKTELSELVSGLTDVFKELEELSRGIHPAILSRGGLPAAFKTLARRSSVPVDLDVVIEQRLPDSLEVAAYYVVAEARQRRQARSGLRGEGAGACHRREPQPSDLRRRDRRGRCA